MRSVSKRLVGTSEIATWPISSPQKSVFNQSLSRSDSRLARFAWLGDAVEVIDESGFRHQARLVVGADGKGSPTRKTAGISISSHAYGQSALTVFLKHTRAHDDVSTEFHTREGPFTLVPLPSAPDAPHRSSLVWIMSDVEARRRMALDEEKLTREIERQSRGIVGSLTIEGDRGLFPMARQRAARLTARRVALVGDAAHVYPPIGAQGLNLGFRDVEDLLGSIKRARKIGGDIGSAPTLSTYERARAVDIAERMIAVNGLNASLTANFAPVDALRGLGLAALQRVGPLRRLVMREGLSPQWARPAP